MSSSPVRVHIQHDFASDPATVFEALSEHERLAPLFKAKIDRVCDGDAGRNGVGSTRRLKIGPLPAFEETTTTSEPNTLIEYRISKGSPLREHWGRQTLTPTATGGTHLDYEIGFDATVPGLATVVGKILTVAISQGLRSFVP